MQLLGKSLLVDKFVPHARPDQRQINELVQRQIAELIQMVAKLEGLVAGLREETLVLLEDEPIKRGG